MAVSVGSLDGGGELFVGEGLGVALLPLVGGVRELAQGRDVGLGKADLLKRHGQPHLLVKGGVALKVLGIARIGKQHEHAQAHDLAVQVGALARDAARGVVERMRHARVVVVIVLVGQVRDIARVDHDVERDLLDGLARQVLAHVL